MRGVRGTQSTGLPKLHVKGPDGKPLCGARPRKWGHIFAQVDHETDCKKCRTKLQNSKMKTQSVPNTMSSWNSHELLKSKGLTPAIYPGHPVVIAYCIVNSFATYEAAFQKTEHGWAAASGDSRVPGAGGCVANALDLLRHLRDGMEFEQAMAWAEDLWGRIDNHSDGGGSFATSAESRRHFLNVWKEGQKQADQVKPLLKEHAVWWTLNQP